MQALGESLAKKLTNGMTVYLCGELGAGKTTLVRGVLRGLGYSGAVKSPTFTLVESYNLDRTRVYHMDFYRVDDERELETIGIRDYFDGSGICLVEWPEKAGSFLPLSDIKVRIEDTKPGRTVKLVASRERANSFTQLIY